MINNEGINSETIIDCCWKSMWWRLSIINWEHGNFQLSCPPARVGLHGPTRKRNKAASMHMQNNGVNLFLTLCKTWHLFSFFWIYSLNDIIINNSNLNCIWIISTYVLRKLFYLVSIRDVYFSVCFYTFHYYLDALSYQSVLW